jgi:hypothetical protein
MPEAMSWGMPRATTPTVMLLAAALAYHTATGSLEAYDPDSRTLTLHSASGSSKFQVAPDARAFLGNRRLPVSQLGLHTGAQATVAWSETAGVRTTHTVRLVVARAGRGK